jgi:hypothetical protein
MLQYSHALRCMVNVAAALILYRNKFLLAKRARGEYTDRWEFPKCDIEAHIPQFFRKFRWKAILYCRGIQKLYFGNPLYGRFCEKYKCKLRNVGHKYT